MQISPGQWHLDVPRELGKNKEMRLKILDMAEGNPAVQRELCSMCKLDILFYINLFVYQFNPTERIASAIDPFITWPAQERLLMARPETHAKWQPYDRGILWCYENEETLVIEKSRWQGASWLQLIFQDWLCVFNPFVQVLNISRNEDAVDDGTKDSLFWKLRYMHDRLPRWMTGDIESMKLYFHFHKTDSEVTGTASTAKAGVGGRASLVNVDEFPEIEKAPEVRQKTAMTANCRIFTGTHLGVGTEFQRMCDPKQSPEIVRQRLHWTDNPTQNQGLYEFDSLNPSRPILHDKSFKYPDGFQFILDGTPTGGPRPGVRSPWYDKKAAGMGDDRAVAMNLDISPEGAAKQFFNGLKIRNIITECARSPLWVGEVVYDRQGRFESIYQDDNGRLKLWIQPMGNGRLPVSRYTMGTDISSGFGGKGSTASCAAGIDGNRSMKVLEYKHAKMLEHEWAQLVVALCWFMQGPNDQGAYLCWDASGQQGSKFEQAVLGLGYSNTYEDGSEKITAYGKSRSRRKGWFSHNDDKYAVLKDYMVALYDRTLVDRSEDCLLETLLFEVDKKGVVSHAGEIRTNDPSGAGKNHGDMVIATSLAWMLAKEMGDGGRKSELASSGVFEAGTIGWMLALEEGRRRREEDW